MLILKIPFNYEKKKRLYIITKGGTHPYRMIDKIEHRRILDNWELDQEYYAPDWVEEIYFILGSKIVKYDCFGRDAFINYNDPYQVTNYTKEPVKLGKVSKEFSEWWKSVKTNLPEKKFEE